MKKVNIKLSSGILDNKTVINGFKNDGNAYVVFDNEAVGSMGLPIILIAKLVNDRLVKIPDQTEWQKVKEFLKSIIAGETVDWIAVADELLADDVYSTQLTLPLLSFDALKENYRPVEPIPENAGPARAINVVIDPTQTVIPAAPVVTSTPEPAPITVEPIISSAMPDVSGVAAPISVAPAVIPVVDVVEPSIGTTPAVPEVPVEPAIPVVPEVPVAPAIPAVPEVPVAPAIPAVPEVPVAPAIPVVPEVPVAPAIPVVPEVESNNYDELKETFMKSCENMFDALIAKLK